MILSEEKRKRDNPIPPVGGVGLLLGKECFKALREGNQDKFAKLLQKMIELEMEKREAFMERE